MSNSPKSKRDLYQEVSDRIIASLEEGVVPWHRPWAVNSQAPMNYITRKPYRGINVLLTGLAGFNSPYWMSYKQAQAKGGQVRFGSKSTTIVFFKMMHGTKEETDANGVTSKKSAMFPFLKWNTVFNAEQIDGIDFPAPVERADDFSPIDAAQSVLDAYSEECPIIHQGGSAHYDIRADKIFLPVQESFESPEAYYTTAFHECAHSTGAESRLKRPGIVQFDKFGSENYGKEELIAEMAAAFIAAETGIERPAPTASYIANWLGAIQGDKKMVVQAGFKAAYAADMVLGREPQTEHPVNPKPEEA